MYADFGGSDIAHCESRETSRNAWSEKFHYICIDMTKKKNVGKHRIFNKSKNTYIECIPVTEPF